MTTELSVDPKATWRSQVADGTTDLGYTEWLAQRNPLDDIGTGRWSAYFTPSVRYRCDGTVEIDWTDSFSCLLDANDPEGLPFDGDDQPEVTNALCDRFDALLGLDAPGFPTAAEQAAVLRRLADLVDPRPADACTVRTHYRPDGGVEVEVIVPGAEDGTSFIIDVDRYEFVEDEPQWVVEIPWPTEYTGIGTLANGVEAAHGLAYLDAAPKPAPTITWTPLDTAAPGHLPGDQRADLPHGWYAEIGSDARSALGAWSWTILSAKTDATLMWGLEPTEAAAKAAVAAWLAKEVAR